MSAPYEVVYQAEPRWANQAARFLRSRGFRPFHVEDPSPVVLQKSHGTYRVRVAVPAALIALWQRRKRGERK